MSGATPSTERGRGTARSLSSSEVLALPTGNISLRSLRQPAAGIRPTPLPNVLPTISSRERPIRPRSYQYHLVAVNSGEMGTGNTVPAQQQATPMVMTPASVQALTTVRRSSSSSRPKLLPAQPIISPSQLVTGTHSMIQLASSTTTMEGVQQKQNIAAHQPPARSQLQQKAVLVRDSSGLLQIQLLTLNSPSEFPFFEVPPGNNDNSNDRSHHQAQTSYQNAAKDAIQVHYSASNDNSAPNPGLGQSEVEVSSAPPSQTYQPPLGVNSEQDAHTGYYLTALPHDQSVLTTTSTNETSSMSCYDENQGQLKLPDESVSPAGMVPGATAATSHRVVTTEDIAKNILARKLLGRSSKNPIYSVPLSHASFLIDGPAEVDESVMTPCEDGTSADCSVPSSTQPVSDKDKVVTISGDPVTVVFDYHAAVLLDKLNIFRKKGDYCDLTIEIGKSQWKCHSTVVAAMCPCLHSLIQVKSSTDSTSGDMTIKLPSVLEEKCFTIILDMIYTGRLCMSKDNVKNLLEVAMYLKLSLAQAECEEYLHKTDSEADEKIVSIYSSVKRLQKPAFCTNDLPEVTENEAVQSVICGSVTAITTVAEACGDEYSDGSLEMDATSNACFDDNTVRPDTNPSQNNQDKPISSLTNLMRVASEAFKDLDQERMEKAQKEGGRSKRKSQSRNQSQSEEKMGSFIETCQRKRKRKPVRQLRSDSEDGDTEHLCKQCNKVFSSQKKLNNHMNLTHSSKRHKCSFCVKTFAKRSDCRIHEQRRHTKEKPFTCTHCGKSFHLNRELQHHVKSHQEGNVHGCHICKKTFQSEAGFKTHMASHGEKNFACRHESCGRTFATTALRNRHEKSHSDTKPFQCTECDKAFQSNHVLLRHKKTHTGEKPFKCESCDRSFVRSEHLRVHMSTHSDERKFECDICHRTFKQISGRNLHRQKHEPSLNFVCDVCGYKCRSKSRLKQHSLTHSTEKPFVCDICSMPFKLKKNLARHKKIHQRKGEVDAETYRKNIPRREEKVKPKQASVFAAADKNRQALNILPVGTNLQEPTQTSHETVNSRGLSGVPVHQENLTPSMDLSGNETLFESLSNVVPTLMMQSHLSTTPNYAPSKNMYFQNTSDSGTSSWECPAGQIQTLEHPTHLPEENYLPVLTAEEVLAADGANVHFPE